MAPDPDRAGPLELTATRAAQEAWQRAYAGSSAADVSEHPPTPPYPERPDATDSLRKRSDQQAAWRRWHRADTEPTLTATERPWYQLFEQARVEALASRELRGMAQNLAQGHVRIPGGARQARLYHLARERFAERAEPALEACEPATERPAPATGTLPSPTHRAPPPPDANPGTAQPATQPGGWFRRRLRRPPRVAPPPTAPPPTDAEVAAALHQASHLLPDGAAFAAVLLPLIQRLAAAPALDGEEPQADTLGSHPAEDALNPPEPPHPPEENAAANQDEQNAAAPETDPIRPLPDECDRPGTAETADTPYRTYSTHWDEERPAQDFCTPQDRHALQSLDPVDQAQVRRLALRLQRQLLSARQRRWQFDQDTGRLDSRRLAKLLIPGAPPRIFRKEQASPAPDACVTLLVDQSGSMRGRPQRLAVQAIDFAVQTLESCRIGCEVLGFTTTEGADNPVSRAWRTHGQSPRPGRLNALRHLIYKAAQDPWRRSRPSLGLLLRADFGRENLDGEALDWAARRLAARPEPRKVLLVLSDAAPYDAATVAAHGRPYLESHLRAVIARIETSPIQLVAIGTSQRVGYYYRQAVVLNRHETVADTLFNQLGQLLTPPDIPRRP